jgi:hypothetical protein
VEIFAVAPEAATLLLVKATHLRHCDGHHPIGFQGRFQRDGTRKLAKLQFLEASVQLLEPAKHTTSNQGCEGWLLRSLIAVANTTV